MSDPDRPTFAVGDRVKWDALTRDQHGIVRQVLRMGTVKAQLVDAFDRLVDGAPIVEFGRRTRGGTYPRSLRHLRPDELARVEWRKAWKDLPLVWTGDGLSLRVNNVLVISTEAELAEFQRQLAEGWRLLQERPR